MQRSKLIEAPVRAESEEITTLDLSHRTFGELVDQTLPLENLVHIEVTYIRDFLFNKNWEHLRYIEFAYQNLSKAETNLINNFFVNLSWCYC